MENLTHCHSIQSNGDLENDERIGSVIVKMLRAAQKQELGLVEDKDGFQRLTSKLFTPEIESRNLLVSLYTCSQLSRSLLHCLCL